MMAGDDEDRMAAVAGMLPEDDLSPSEPPPSDDMDGEVANLMMARHLRTALESKDDDALAMVIEMIRER